MKTIKQYIEQIEALQEENKELRETVKRLGIECDQCGEYFPKEEIIKAVDYNSYCEECYDDIEADLQVMDR